MGRRLTLRMALALVVLAGLAVPLASQDTVTLGFAVIELAGGSRLAGGALFSLRNPQGVLVSEAGAGAVQASSGGRIFVDQRGVQTGVALVNASPGAVALELTLRGSDGAVVQRSDASVAAGSSLVDNVSNLFPNLADGFTGSLSFEARDGGRVAALTLRQNSNQFNETVLATLPVADLAESSPDPLRLVFPQVGAGAGLSSQIILIERSGRVSNGTIRFTGSDGAPLRFGVGGGAPVSEFTYQLAANGILATDLESPDGTRQGYATVTPEAGSTLPAGAAVFRFTSGGSVVSEAGVSAAPATTRARLFVDGVQTRTGIAVANPGAQSLRLTLDLSDRNGYPLGSLERGLPSGGHFAIFADELFPDLPENFTGLLDLRAEQPFHAVTLKLSQNQRGDPILTTLPLADLDSPPGDATLVIPRLGFGPIPGVGEFQTRLILLNLNPSGPAEGRLSFFSPQGDPLTVPLSGARDSQFSLSIPARAGRQLRPGDGSEAVAIAFEPEIADSLELPLQAGGSSILRPTIVDARNNLRDDFEFSFASLSPEVASIDGLGKVTGGQPGFSTLVVSAGGLATTVTAVVSETVSGSAGFGVYGVARDRARRIYLSSRRDNVILLADALQSAADVWAGVEGAAGLLDAPRLESLFNRPGFLAINQAEGALYAADSGNHSIRRIETRGDGSVTTLAGNGVPGYRDGPLSEARFNRPSGLALDATGNLWVADSDNHVIRRIRLAERSVETLAGQPGVSGSRDGVGAQATFDTPVGLALVPEPLSSQLERQLTGAPPPPTSLIVADSGNGLLRRVYQDGRVETLDAALPALSRRPPGRTLHRGEAAPLAGAESVAVDPLGDVYVSIPSQRRVMTRLRDGRLVAAAPGGLFTDPRALVVAENGRLLVADGSGALQIQYGGPEIERVSPDRISNRGGQIVTVQGRNFAPESVVIIAGRVVADVFDDSTRLQFAAPELPSGLTTLTVQTRGGIAQAPLLVESSLLTDLAPGDITTLVGGATFLGDGGPAREAPVPDPQALAFDGPGNLFVVDSNQHRVRRIDALTGVITSVAGTGAFGFAGDGGPAAAASLCFPEGLAIDRQGDLYVADTANQRIRKIVAATGAIETIAGSSAVFAECANSPGFSGDGGPALEAEFNSPRGLAVDGDGNLYVADGSNRRIRRVDSATGIIETIAGSGQAGYSGDGGPALEASFGRLFGIALGRDDGQLWVADRSNHAVRRIDLARGSIETVAGDGSPGFSGDGGPPALARLNLPQGIDVDDSGGVLVADTENHRVRRIGGGTIDTLAGDGTVGFSGDGGPSRLAQLNRPSAVVADNYGGTVIADSGNSRLRQSSRDERIDTLAGTGAGAFVNEGEAAAADLNSPSGVATDGDGNLVVVDRANFRVLRIEGLQGRWTTLAGTGLRGLGGDGGPATQASLVSPRDVAIDSGGNIFLSDGDTIRRIDAGTGMISRFAGTGAASFSGDGGPASLAGLDSPDGLALDGLGNLYVADSGNHRIRRVDGDGVISTVAGNGLEGFSGDGGPALDASLNRPARLAWDGRDGLYVADRGNQRIRRIDLAGGVIETVAGGAEAGFAGDGGPANAALLAGPRGLAAGSDGSLWIADTGNRRLRRIAPDGVIATVAGDGIPQFRGDNGPAGQAGLGSPFAVAIDSSGNVVFADAFHNRVRAIRGPVAGGPP